MRDRLPENFDIIIFVLILAIAGTTRMLQPGLTEFKADEARLLALAWDMADFNSFPMTGINSSAGFPNFPASVWLYALPLMVVKHVFAPTLFTGLLNTLAVGFSYFFTRRYFSRTTAIVTAFMFAVSPWAIVHSRKIWAQNLLPFFVILWAYTAAFAFLDEEKPKYWVGVHVFLAIFAFQIHLAAGSLVLATFALLIFFWRKIDIQWVLSGIVVAMIAALPLIADFAGSLGSGGVAASIGGPRFSLSGLYHAVRLTTGWQLHALAGPLQFQNYLDSLPAMDWVFITWGALVIWGLLAILWNPLPARVRAALRSAATNTREVFEPVTPAVAAAATGSDTPPGGGGGGGASPTPSPNPPAGSTESGAAQANLDHISQVGMLTSVPGARTLLLVWCLVPLLTFLIFPVSVELHYLLPLYPAVYILAGVGIHLLYRISIGDLSLRPPGPTQDLASMIFFAVAVVLLLISSGFQVWGWFNLLNLVEDASTPRGFGNPLAYQLEIVEEAQRLAENEAYGINEIIIAGHGENPDHDEFPAVFGLHLRDVRDGAGNRLPIRMINLDEGAVFPTGSSLVLVEDIIQPLAKSYQREAQTEFFPTTRIGDPQHTLFLLRGTAPEPEVSFAEPPRLANSVRFVGYDRLTRDGLFQLYWTAGTPNPEPDYHIFNQLIDSEGQRISQADAAAFSAAQWRSGDQIVSRFNIAYPDDATPTTIRSGMYLYPSLEGVYLLDIANNPYTDAVEIPVDELGR